MKEIINLDNYYNKRASFYNKCRAEKENDIITLYSYDTEILRYDIKNNKFIYIDNDIYDYSGTTLRHIRSFLYYLINVENTRLDHVYKNNFLYEMNKAKLLKYFNIKDEE